MAQLTYNSVSKFRYYGQEEFENESGKQGEDTLRDSLLKQIISNQFKANFNIEDCLKSKTKFTQAAKQKDISNSTKGLLNNETYKKICSEFNMKEVLSSCDLEEDEVEILLDQPRQGRNESDEAYVQKLNHIREKLELRQTYLETDVDEQFSGAVRLTRHEYEEEFSKVSSTAAEKLTPCLVQLKPYSDPNLHPDHPLNSLPALEKKLFPETTVRDTQHDEILPKRKHHEEEESSFQKVKYFKEKPKSFWDMKERPVIASQAKPKLRKMYGCEPAGSTNKMDGSINSITIIGRQNEPQKMPDFSKPFIWTLPPSKLIPVENIHANTMTLDQIKQDPKFLHYSPGTPSSTLYVKNLPHKLQPIQIVSLFGHLEEENGPKIEYRLLKGRMKGQAFIKLPAAEVAVKAFQLCNGYVIEDKPIVLEYSKKGA